MILINSTARFLGSGVLKADQDTIIFRDTYLTGDLKVAEAGQAALDDRFVTDSVLGAINELKDNVVGTSGQITSSVTKFTQALDTVAFIHDVSHGLNSFFVTTALYDQSPASVPGQARPVLANIYPIDANTVRVELDNAASGFLIVHA
jgi:hypothetical protein